MGYKEDAMQNYGFYNGDALYGQEEFNMYFDNMYESGVSSRNLRAGCGIPFPHRNLYRPCDQASPDDHPVNAAWLPETLGGVVRGSSDQELEEHAYPEGGACRLGRG